MGLTKKVTLNQQLAQLRQSPALLRRQSVSLRERVAARALESIDMLQRVVRGEEDVPPTRIKAAQVLLDRCLPVMSQSEVQVTDDYAGLAPDQLLALLHARISELPAAAELLPALPDPMQPADLDAADTQH